MAKSMARSIVYLVSGSFDDSGTSRLEVGHPQLCVVPRLEGRGKTIQSERNQTMCYKSHIFASKIKLPMGKVGACGSVTTTMTR